MKKRIRNIMAATGFTLVVLAGIATLYNAAFLSIHSIFQIFGANIVIHFGFILTGKFESKYTILEILLDMSYVIAVLILFGSVFKWFNSTPVWVLISMAVIIYSFGCLINIFHMKDDVGTINKLLEERKQLMNGRERGVS